MVNKDLAHALAAGFSMPLRQTLIPPGGVIHDYEPSVAEAMGFHLRGMKVEIRGLYSGLMILDPTNNYQCYMVGPPEGWAPSFEDAMEVASGSRDEEEEEEEEEEGDDEDNASDGGAGEPPQSEVEY